MISQTVAQRNAWILSMLCGVALATGCSSARIVTEVSADGSYTRTLTFNLAAPPMGKAPKLEEVNLPPSEKDWKHETKKKDQSVYYTMSKAFKKGESAQDLNIMQKVEKKKQPRFGAPPPKKEEKTVAPKILLVNSVNVKEIAPGRFEYTETLAWKGKREVKNDILSEEEAKGLSELKAMMPKKLATDENVKKIQDAVLGIMTKIMFGPGEPLLGQLMMQTDYAIIECNIRLGNQLIEWLEKTWGADMTEAQRVKIAKKILEVIGLEDKINKSLKDAQKQGPGAPKKEEKKKEETELLPMTFVLKFPGKVLETNGKLDRFSGRVVWCMYPQATTQKDVVLRVVFTAK